MSVIPVAVYPNAEIQKKQIIKETKGKSGVYRWTNLQSGKSYVGSGVNLSMRLSHYYSKKHMETYLKNGKSALYTAILKHGPSKFTLEILEYCQPSDTISREQYYLDLLKPEYNILKVAGSSLGYKYDDEAKKKMSDSKKGENNPCFGRTGENNPMYGKARPAGAGCPSKQIEVTDLEEKTTTTYNSMSEAAKALNFSHTVIVKYFKFNRQKPYKNRYVFTITKIDS